MSKNYEKYCTKCGYPDQNKNANYCLICGDLLCMRKLEGNKKK